MYYSSLVFFDKLTHVNFVDWLSSVVSRM